MSIFELILDYINENFINTENYKNVEAEISILGLLYPYIIPGAIKLIKEEYITNIKLLRKICEKLNVEELNVLPNVTYISYNSTDEVNGLSYIKRVYADGDVECYAKRKIINPREIVRNELCYKFRISTEEYIDIKSFNFDSIKLVRIKLTLRIPLIDNWNLDFSLVRQLNITDTLLLSSKIITVLKQDFKNIKQGLYPLDVILGFSLFHSPSYIVEIELERESIKRKISLDEIINIISYIETVILHKEEEKDNKMDKNDEDYKTSIYSIAAVLYGSKVALDDYRNSTLKLLVTQVVTLDVKNITKILSNPREWTVTDKADGERCLICLSKKITGEAFVLSSIKKTIESEEDIPIILDAEYVDGIYYVFDIMYYDRSVVNDTYEIRLKMLDSIFKKYAKSKAFSKIKLKRIKIINSIDIIDDLYSEDSAYEIDGLIFTHLHSDYKTSPFKWKPLSKLTIDFYVKKSIPHSKDKKGRSLYYLFNGISNTNAKMLNLHNPKIVNDKFGIMMQRPYRPVLFQPSIWKSAGYVYLDDTKIDYDEKICEMLPDIEKLTWKITRIREDRNKDLLNGTYYGNNFSVAESTIMLHFMSLDISDLTKYIKDALENKEYKLNKYFQINNNPQYKGLRAAISIGKQKSFAFVYNHAEDHKISLDHAFDMGPGKGQDINRYKYIGIKTLFSAEKDKFAIMELIRRKYDYRNSNYNTPLGIYVMQEDLNEVSSQQFIKHLSDRGFSGTNSYQLVVSNLSLHYFAETEDALNKILEITKSLLARNCYFICTVFNGKRVYELLKNNNGIWSPSDKYKIVAEYKNSKSFKPFKHKIKLKLPFSDEDLYEETLLDTDDLITRLDKLGFELIYDVQFSSNELNFRGLDPIDETMLNLYSTYVFIKTGTRYKVASKVTGGSSNIEINVYEDYKQYIVENGNIPTVCISSSIKVNVDSQNYQIVNDINSLYIKKGFILITDNLSIIQKITKTRKYPYLIYYLNKNPIDMPNYKIVTNNEDYDIYIYDSNVQKNIIFRFMDLYSDAQYNIYLIDVLKLYKNAEKKLKNAFEVYKPDYQRKCLTNNEVYADDVLLKSFKKSLLYGEIKVEAYEYHIQDIRIFKELIIKFPSKIKNMAAFDKNIVKTIGNGLLLEPKDKIYLHMNNTMANDNDSDNDSDSDNDNDNNEFTILDYYNYDDISNKIQVDLVIIDMNYSHNILSEINIAKRMISKKGIILINKYDLEDQRMLKLVDIYRVTRGFISAFNILNSITINNLLIDEELKGFAMLDNIDSDIKISESTILKKHHLLYQRIDQDQA